MNHTLKYFLLLMILLSAFISNLSAQSNTIVHQTDSTLMKDTVPVLQPANRFQQILDSNRIITFSTTPKAYPVIEKQRQESEFNFYFLLTLLSLFGLSRVAFPKYFTNLFRVFFNTSLRQGQITDQLLQAKLPSLFFNVLFVLTSGFYLYLLLQHWNKVDTIVSPLLLSILIAGVGLMYLVKYAVIRFTGWVSGYSRESESYIFIVFLVNKIVGVALLPLLPIMAFSKEPLQSIGFTVSYIVIILLILLRFLRSYENLHARMQINRFHFFLYLIGIEILPLILVYKAAMQYLPEFA